MNSYIDLLNNDPYYAKRKTYSNDRIQELKARMESVFSNPNISIFVMGSLARREAGKKSDLDLFVVSKKPVSKLDQIDIFSNLIEINADLGFPPFSNDGQFLVVHQLEEMKMSTGSPEDDYHNLFTARMLMILESEVLYNPKLHEEILSEIISHYLRDRKMHEDFKPLFLLNDLLRFWRTLCLNYEVIRHDQDRPWRKKNINLKYSRMITVFSTVSSIISQKKLNEEDIYKLCANTPFERLAIALSYLQEDYTSEFDELLGHYKIFLDAKENDDIEQNPELKNQLDRNADRVSEIFYNILSSESIHPKIRRFLVV